MSEDRIPEKSQIIEQCWCVDVKKNMDSGQKALLRFCFLHVPINSFPGNQLECILTASEIRMIPVQVIAGIDVLPLPTRANPAHSLTSNFKLDFHRQQFLSHDIPF